MVQALSLCRLAARFVVTVSFAALLFAASFSAALAQSPPSLGTAQSFAVLAGSTVTNTGPTYISGDLGVSPGTEVTGFPPGIVIGEIHTGDDVALQAQNDVITAYDDLAGRPCDRDLSDTDLGGLTLMHGVYCFRSEAHLTGTLTLDAGGSSKAVFIFQIGSALITGPGASVLLVNGGQDDGVFWQVGSSATLDTTTAFKGSILALTSITLNTGARIGCGRALARNAAVTLDTNDIYVPIGCNCQ